MVLMVDRQGSVPQDIGSRMIVIDGPPNKALHWGTVGGGRVEAAAIDHALAIMAGDELAGLVQWNLNTDLGMTCGGRVHFFFEHVPATPWPIHIFGAGHVCQALCQLLTSLPCQVTVHDPRRQWIDRLPPGVDGRCEEFDAAVIETLPDHSFVMCMTRGHSHDLPILRAIAASGRTFAFLGVIGSKTKAGSMRRELKNSGVDIDGFEFHCPIGLPIGTNHPAEIAISIAGQLLQVRDQK